ncbi:putative tyrosine-protein kinase [Exaiptasia diaphana]|nr:putative tyrosine-protein kinase [Exaiptasia diaphana]
MRSKCQHRFCGSCIDAAFEHRRECPTCTEDYYCRVTAEVETERAFQDLMPLSGNVCRRESQTLSKQENHAHLVAELQACLVKQQRNCNVLEASVATEKKRFEAERNRCEELEASLEAKTIRCNELETSIEAKTIRCEELEASLEAKTIRSEEPEASLEAERSKYCELQATSAQKERNKVQRSASENLRRATYLRTSFAEAQRTNMRLQASLNESQCTINQLQDSLEESQAFLEVERCRVTQLQASLDEEQRRFNRQETEYNQLRNALEEVQRTNQRMQIELTEERGSRQEIERQQQEAQNMLRVAERTANELQTRCEELVRQQRPDWILTRNEIALSDRIIGSGAWGEVLEGTFRGCTVAVKRIHQLILSPHNRRLFEREMNMASRCRHPCLLQFIGATADDAVSPLFVTELLETTLRSVLEVRGLEPAEILAIALDVARGLNYLHLNHPDPIIHRDINSGNVLLWRQNNSWRAKVSDYGTANFFRQCSTVSPGAPAYSAPEASDVAQQTSKIDVFSFGILLCEMNIRELPDLSERNLQVAMVSNQRQRELIQRCLLRNPDARPCIGEVIDILLRSREDPISINETS